MFEGLILEIELDIVIVGAVAHRDVKEDLDSALGYRSQLVWLAEFNVVSKWNSDGTKVSEMRLRDGKSTYWSTLPYSAPKKT